VVPVGFGSAAGLALEARIAGVAVDFCSESGLGASCVSPIGLGDGRRGCGFLAANPPKLSSIRGSGWSRCSAAGVHLRPGPPDRGGPLRYAPDLAADSLRTNTICLRCSGISFPEVQQLASQQNIGKSSCPRSEGRSGSKVWVNVFGEPSHSPVDWEGPALQSGFWCSMRRAMRLAARP